MIDAEFVARLLEGDRRAVARSLTWVENGTPDGRDLLRQIYPRSGRAHVVGVTGAGGAGKSTLVNAFAKEWRRRGKTVGIIAVDPSSPFTRGAILGDRIRMQDLVFDAGVFIRSMASRGTIGGIAATTVDAVTVMDAAGFDVVVVETIGAGQDEVEIVRAAETILLVLNPNQGDEIQSLKAGIIEIADVVAVNKADIPGADQVVANLKMVMSLVAEAAWVRPIVKTIATTEDGVVAAIDAVAKHLAQLEETGERRRRGEDRVRHQLDLLVRDELVARTVGATGDRAVVEAAVGDVIERRLDPRSAATRVVDEALTRYVR